MIRQKGNKLENCFKLQTKLKKKKKLLYSKIYIILYKNIKTILCY